LPLLKFQPSYIGAATVSPLIEEIIPYGKRFGTRKFYFQQTGFIDVLCESWNNSDDFPIQNQFTGFNNLDGMFSASGVK